MFFERLVNSFWENGCFLESGASKYYQIRVEASKGRRILCDKRAKIVFIIIFSDSLIDR